MKVIVFGATGYLGSHVAEQLVVAGHQVICPVRNLPPPNSNNTRSQNNLGFLQQLAVDLVQVDFAELSGLNEWVDEHTVVCNCIADTRSHASYQQRSEVELTLTRQLFQWSQQRQVKRFIQLGPVYTNFIPPVAPEKAPIEA